MTQLRTISIGFIFVLIITFTLFIIIFLDEIIKNLSEEMIKQFYKYKEYYKKIKPLFNSLVLTCSFLETKDHTIDTLNVNIKSLILKQLEQGNISIKNTIINAKLDINIKNKTNIVGTQIIDVLSSDIAFKKTNKYIVILNKSFIKTKGIKSNVSIFGDLSNPKFKITSNIENVLKDKVKNVFDSQENSIKKEIKIKVKNQAKSKLKGILDFKR